MDDQRRKPMYPAGEKVPTYTIPKLELKEIAVLKQKLPGFDKGKTGGLPKMKMPTLPKEYGLPKVKGNWGASQKASMFTMGGGMSGVKAPKDTMPSTYLGGMGASKVKAPKDFMPNMYLGGMDSGKRGKSAVSVSDTLGVSVAGEGKGFSGQNFRNALMGLESGARKVDPGSQIRMHLGLRPLDDSDRDGVPNFMDCQPLNPRKQGPEQNIKGEVRYMDPTTGLQTYGGTPSEGALEIYSTDAEDEEPPRVYTTIKRRAEPLVPFPVGTIVEAPKEEEFVIGERTVKAGIQKARAAGRFIKGKAVGLGGYAQERVTTATKEALLTPLERKKREVEILGGGAAGGGTYARIQEAKYQYGQGPVEKARIEAAGRARVAEARAGISSGGGGFDFGLTGMGAAQSVNLGRAGSGIMLASAIPSTGMGISQMSMTGMTPAEAKVTAFMGLGGGAMLSEPRIPFEPLEPQMEPTMASMPSPVPIPRARAPAAVPTRSVVRSENVCPPGTVYSTRSKRCVAFERGSYQKHSSQ